MKALEHRDRSLIERLVLASIIAAAVLQAGCAFLAGAAVGGAAGYGIGHEQGEEDPEPDDD